jgi:hypothetical protein
LLRAQSYSTEIDDPFVCRPAGDIHAIAPRFKTWAFLDNLRQTIKDARANIHLSRTGQDEEIRAAALGTQQGICGKSRQRVANM